VYFVILLGVLVALHEKANCECFQNCIRNFGPEPEFLRSNNLARKKPKVKVVFLKPFMQILITFLRKKFNIIKFIKPLYASSSLSATIHHFLNYFKEKSSSALDSNSLTVFTNCKTPSSLCKFVVDVLGRSLTLMFVFFRHLCRPQNCQHFC